MKNLKKQNRIHTYFLFFLLFLAGLIGCDQGSTKTTSDEKSTIIYLVRHAEKDTTDKSDNPALTKEGEDRALKLLELIGNQPFKSIWSTPYQRNINTVKPIAEQQNITIQHYEWHEWKEEINSIKNTGNAHIVCGHGDNLVHMIEHLNGTPPLPKVGSHDYSNIFKLEVLSDTCFVEWIKY